MLSEEVGHIVYLSYILNIRFKRHQSIIYLAEYTNMMIIVRVVKE